MLRFMRLHSVYSASFYTDYISVRAVFPLQKPHIHRLKFAVIRYAHYILNRMYCPCPQSTKLLRQKGGKPIFPDCFGVGCRIVSGSVAAFFRLSDSTRAVFSLSACSRTLPPFRPYRQSELFSFVLPFSSAFWLLLSDFPSFTSAALFSFADFSSTPAAPFFTSSAFSSAFGICIPEVSI